MNGFPDYTNITTHHTVAIKRLIREC